MKDGNVILLNVLKFVMMGFLLEKKNVMQKIKKVALKIVQE